MSEDRTRVEFVAHGLAGAAEAIQRFSEQMAKIVTAWRVTMDDLAFAMSPMMMRLPLRRRILYAWRSYRRAMRTNDERWIDLGLCVLVGHHDLADLDYCRACGWTRQRTVSNTWVQQNIRRNYLGLRTELRFIETTGC